NYGPGLKITDRRVIPDFVQNILRQEDVVMLSDGKPMRTFCYVADAVSGYFRILTKGRPGQAYNIGVEQPEISMRQLAEQLIELSREHIGYKGKLVVTASEDSNYLIDNPNRRCPIIKKARDELGYNPSIDLKEGLKRSLIWYVSNSEGENS
ncbi:MAG: NAD-dependent epimerase/dehydratase family protein, partial [Sphingobacteriales bacterium]